MVKQIVNPPTVSTPRGYSHAVRKAGVPVHVAGQVSIDPSGAVVGPGDIEAQARQAFANLAAVVGACGGSMADIVKTTVFVTDLGYRPAVAAARQEHWPDGDFPASTFVVISSLALPELLVEVEAVAMIE
jgi:enamine deaminase RidA (YjgF/YER057c/UK114 family)